ncbi:type I-E CRISPR-associated protein Cas6/Cse3/CasE [Streptomyces sp. NBC_01498]|uniref:type I-E CRISPR-associated protein Cas6/Cse3/CasE n=1 Tax=Streptomyces sp. NBC_01498 TaxID=2975870 RepID=UPI002E7BE910|nr:type I-E CRISPR-associated protein Cas6/Cse3/CasE [Streptomyces sp. NBC_01498]WTL27055.1 type I-E CRISPR-associated protein Cas6/Cse3/CasE [Streptomyces sp. NBC_01498]
MNSTDTDPTTESAATATAGPATGQAWLTRLLLNPRSRAVQRDLRNITDLHRTVMNLVPDDLGDTPRARAGLLFRLETDGTGDPVLLVQTRTPPSTGRLPHGYARVESRPMDTLLAALRPSLLLRYRLAANAVRRCGPNSTAGRWKQAIPLHGPEADQWWIDRATASGLAPHTLVSRSTDTATTWHATNPKTVLPAPAPPTTTDPKSVAGATPRANRRIDRAVTLFEGTAQVTDPAALRSALLNGIGRSKSYGCGLLSLAPAHPGA